MNHLPNFKIEILCKQIAENDIVIMKNFATFDESNIRFSIDRRRHLLALLDREVEATKGKHGKLSTDTYTPKIETQQLIDAWCNQVNRSEIQNISFKCSNFCNLLLDHALPKSWNFDDDLIIIHQPQSIDIIKVLKNRNQKYVIIYADADTISAEIVEFVARNSVDICTSLENLERTVSLLQISAKQVISISCESNPTMALDAKLAIADAVNAGKRTRTENTATVSKFGKPWSSNILKNFRNLKESKNLHQLNVSGVEEAIIVASGPSLTKNVEKLRDIQSSVFILAALRSLPILNEAGIEADLVIQLDAENDEVASKLSPNTSNPVKNLLLEATVNPGFFEMPARNIIWSLPQHFFDIHKNFNTKPTPFNVPSVSIYALSLCQFLGFKNICFIGQDLAASSGKQYADGATDLLPAHADISMFQLEVPGFFGNTVLTRNSYQYQIKRCSEIAREWESQHLGLNLVNATEGGAYISGFNHMTLDAFIEQRQLRTKQANKLIEFSGNCPITNDGAENYLQTIHDTMTRISAIADTIIKLDNQPARTSGINKKMRKMIQKFQNLNNSTSLLQIAMQDSIADVIGTSRKIETVSSYTQFFTKVKDTASALQAAARSNNKQS